MKTLLIPEFNLVSLTEEEREEHVKDKLREAGFDMDKKYIVRKGYNGAGFIFEQ